MKKDSWREVARTLRSLVKPGEQKELAKALGVTAASLSRYLSAERVPSDPLLTLRLFKLLGVDLLGGAKTKSRMSAQLVLPLRRISAHLLAASREASELLSAIEAETRHLGANEPSEENPASPARRKPPRKR